MKYMLLRYQAGPGDLRYCFCSKKEWIGSRKVHPGKSFKWHFKALVYFYMRNFKKFFKLEV